MQLGTLTHTYTGVWDIIIIFALCSVLTLPDIVLTCRTRAYEVLLSIPRTLYSDVYAAWQVHTNQQMFSCPARLVLLVVLLTRKVLLLPCCIHHLTCCVPLNSLLTTLFCVCIQGWSYWSCW